MRSVNDDTATVTVKKVLAAIVAMFLYGSLSMVLGSLVLRGKISDLHALTSSRKGIETNAFGGLFFTLFAPIVGMLAFLVTKFSTGHLSDKPWNGDLFLSCSDRSVASFCTVLFGIICSVPIALLGSGAAAGATTKAAKPENTMLAMFLGGMLAIVGITVASMIISCLSGCHIL